MSSASVRVSWRVGAGTEGNLSPELNDVAARTVVLSGESMLLSLLAAGLEQSSGRQLAQCIPDVLIFDLAAAGVDHRA